MIDPQSEVILRQRSYLAGHILLINPPADMLYQDLAQDLKVSIWTWNYADYQFFKTQNIQQELSDTTLHFSVEFPHIHVDQVIIFTPKSKELLSYILHTVSSCVEQGKSVFLVGEKKGGVERAAKQVQTLGKSLKLDSARHCQLWQTVLEETTDIKPLDEWLKYYPVHVNNIDLQIAALPGVFSQNRLDIGTAILLPYLNKIKTGHIADFGCGSGIISAYLAKSNSQHHIYALDIDAFALKSTELTFKYNNLNIEQLQIQPVTGIQDLTLKFDAIVSNPPFHQGIHTDYAASEQLCRESKKHLKIHGQLWIVANRFLNYSSLIEQQFGQCQIVTDQQGFKVLYAKA